MIETRIVIPCHNEARRLDAAAFRAALRTDPGLTLVFVDDGSGDGTLERLRELAQGEADRVRVLSLHTNRGKAVAVRFGITEALRAEARYVGFLDADLAAPFSEMTRLRAVLERRPELEGAIASRVPFLGGGVDRAPARLAAGGLAAWAVTHVLRLPIGDASCGAKLFRVSDATRAVFAEPFLSRWIFDVEILVRYRLLAGGRAFDGPPPPLVELPVESWRERGGSKIRAGDYARALVDLFRIRRHYGHRKAGRGPPEPVRRAQME